MTDYWLTGGCLEYALAMHRDKQRVLQAERMILERHPGLGCTCGGER